MVTETADTVADAAASVSVEENFVPPKKIKKKKKKAKPLMSQQ